VKVALQSRAARRKIERQFDAAIVVGRVEDLYKDLVKGRARAAD
jgi:hypothetical protein